MPGIHLTSVTAGTAQDPHTHTPLSHPLRLWAGQVCGRWNILQRSSSLGGSPARKSDVKNQRAAPSEQVCRLGHPDRTMPPNSDVKHEVVRLEGPLPWWSQQRAVESQLSWGSSLMA